MDMPPFYPQALTLDTVFVANRDLVACELDDEVVIMSPQTGLYYGLDQVGARVWELLQEPRSIGSICAIVQQDYAVTPEQCERDLLALFEQLAAQTLIEPAVRIPA
jgi:hypothetical protein